MLLDKTRYYYIFYYLLQMTLFVNLTFVILKITTIRIAYLNRLHIYISLSCSKKKLCDVYVQNVRNIYLSESH